ncbi:Pre-mRNA-processing factor 39 [Phytophthora megakarya]|uniref:Pre-mRNA-processing factor 39 n=1 Tax=Phytophthora megakarya TaxID=4795 RepID=A0A225WD98_9STRA|nr:Pre-mRNA-processing factor 39 [Phytophthora megakarya]
MEDTLALSSYGAKYLASHTLDKCTLERLETHRRRRDKERRRLDAKAANLVLTWRCHRFPMHGLPPLELKTSDYLIPEVQTLIKSGGSAQVATKVNEDALRSEIKRYSKTLQRRVEVRQQELIRDLQRQQEQLELRERKKLGFRRELMEIADAKASSTDANGATTVPAVKTPLENLTETVDKNPLDFNSWVSLLALVQTEAPREMVEATYDRFLTEFPLCFGYWNKYAQYEYGLRNKTIEEGVGNVATLEEAQQKAREVYERGVVAVRHSVDMWMKYCEFLIHTLHSPVEETRPALESAMEACGADPSAGPLWELYIHLETVNLYIHLETVNNDMPRLNNVFKRIMHQPLRNLEEFWEKYNQFVLAQQLSALATTEEQKMLAGSGEALMDEGLLRVKIVNAVEAVKNKTMEDIYLRQAFEASIDRSYFHVTPVTEVAMKNWHSYLDFEEEAGNYPRCQTLYERCLISCANYEEIWLRYAEWVARVHGFDAADAVFQRAVTIFLKYRASIYLEYAAFLETHNKLQKAQDTYMKVLSDVAPKLAEAFLHYCNFERRRGDVETAKTWYERGMETVESEADVYAYVASSYAMFLHNTIGDTASARAVLERAALKRSESVLLWLSYIHFEINVTAKTAEFVSRVTRVYELALQDGCNLSMDEKNDLWFQYVEFVENYGDNIAHVREVRKKEMAWKLKFGQSRNRTIKVLNFQPGLDSDLNGYSSHQHQYLQPQLKRRREQRHQHRLQPTIKATRDMELKAKHTLKLILRLVLGSKHTHKRNTLATTSSSFAQLH